LSKKVCERAGDEAIVLSIDFGIVAVNFFVPTEAPPGLAGLAGKMGPRY
jgi:hypothetical protein